MSFRGGVTYDNITYGQENGSVMLGDIWFSGNELIAVEVCSELPLPVQNMNIID